MPGRRSRNTRLEKAEDHDASEVVFLHANLEFSIPYKEDRKFSSSPVGSLIFLTNKPSDWPRNAPSIIE